MGEVKTEHNEKSICENQPIPRANVFVRHQYNDQRMYNVPDMNTIVMIFNNDDEQSHFEHNIKVNMPEYTYIQFEPNDIFHPVHMVNLVCNLTWKLKDLVQWNYIPVQEISLQSDEIFSLQFIVLEK